MKAIFISYRREDAEGQAGRLFDDLTMHFGEDAVFMDVAGIEPGRDFRRVIDEHVASCGVLLAVIGKNWLDIKDASGRRRLDDSADFIHLEIASALKRDIPVIPVVVGGATVPRPDQLPPGLVDLAYRNGVELTHARWNSDIQVLIKALRPYVASPQKDGSGPKTALDESVSSRAGTGEAPPPSDKRGADTTEQNLVAPGTRKPLPWVVAASLLTIALAVGGYFWYHKGADERIRRTTETDQTTGKAAVQTGKTGSDMGLAIRRHGDIAWSEWREVTGRRPTDVALDTSAFEGRVYLFIKGVEDDKIYLNTADASKCDGWGRWTQVPGDITTDVAVTSAALSGYLYLFAKTVDGRILMNHRKRSAEWSGWRQVPGAFVTDVALDASTFDGELYLFGKGAKNRRIHVNIYDGKTWSGWRQVPGGTTTNASPASAVADKSLHLFSEGTDGRIYANRFRDGKWSGWFDATGKGPTDMVLSAAGGGSKVLLFSKGINDGKIYMNPSSDRATSGAGFSTWDGWTEVPGGLTTAMAPAVSVGPDNNVCLFANTIDQRIYVTRAHGLSRGPGRDGTDSPIKESDFKEAAAPPKPTTPADGAKKADAPSKDRAVRTSEEVPAASRTPTPSKKVLSPIIAETAKPVQQPASPKKVGPPTAPAKEQNLAAPPPVKTATPSESAAPVPGGPLQVRCSLVPESISPGSSSHLTVSVSSPSGAHVVDASVNVNTTGGSFETTWASKATGRTDEAGRFRVKWEAPSASEWFSSTKSPQSGYDVYVEVRKPGFNSGTAKCRINIR